MITVKRLVEELQKQDQNAMVILSDGSKPGYYEEMAVAKFGDEGDVVVIRPTSQHNPVIPFNVIEKGWRPKSA